MKILVKVLFLNSIIVFINSSTEKKLNKEFNN